MIEIELNDVQRQALQADRSRPLAVVDPATQRRYVLIACEEYERVRPFLESGREPPPAHRPG